MATQLGHDDNHDVEVADGDVRDLGTGIYEVEWVPTAAGTYTIKVEYGGCTGAEEPENWEPVRGSPFVTSFLHEPADPMEDDTDTDHHEPLDHLSLAQRAWARDISFVQEVLTDLHDKLNRLRLLSGAGDSPPPAAGGAVQGPRVSRKSTIHPHAGPETKTET